MALTLGFVIAHTILEAELDTLRDCNSDIDDGRYANFIIRNGYPRDIGILVEREMREI
jgi:hypothetical protein